jgi:hypothetical protein
MCNKPSFGVRLLIALRLKKPPLPTRVRFYSNFTQERVPCWDKRYLSSQSAAT